MQDPPVTDPSAQCVETSQEFHVAPERVLAHLGKCPVDAVAVVGGDRRKCRLARLAITKPHVMPKLV